MRRHELSDEQWAAVEPLIPRSTATTGRPPSDRRLMLDGLFWILATGAPWRDLPERFGPWQTVYDHFRKWRKSGVFAAIIEALQVKRSTTRGTSTGNCGASTAPMCVPPAPRPGLTKKSRTPRRRTRRPRIGPQPRRVWIEVPPGH